MGVTPIDYHKSVLNNFIWLAFRQRPLYLHVQGKNQEQVNSKLETFSCLIHSNTSWKPIGVWKYWIWVMSCPNPYLSGSSEAVMRIKEIISEDLLRASAASGGQQIPIMPPLTLYPQPPRPVIPAAVPRMPNATSVTGQGHRPAAPHIGVSR